jgi:hypothetical protein
MVIPLINFAMLFLPPSVVSHRHPLGDALLRNPMIGIADCGARARSGQATAADLRRTAGLA